MYEIMPYILGGLLAGVLVLTFFLVFFLIKWKKDKHRLLEETDRKCEEIKREMTEHAENRYKAGKQDAVDVIRTTIDTIQNDKEEFEKMDEKNLLVETMLALGSYARRLDRIEEKIKIISNYNLYIESMNQAMEELRGNLDKQRNEIDEIDTFVKRFSSDSQRITSTVDMVNTRLADVANISSRTEEIITKLRVSTAELDNINDRVNDISEKMDGFFSNYSDSPMVVIHTILNKTENIISQIDELGSELSAEIGSIDSNIDDVSSDVKEIKELADSTLSIYGSYSVYEKVDDLKRDLDNIEYDVNHIKSSITNSYEYDSIYSKISDIESKLGNIDSRLP